MEIKKSPSASLETRRGTHFLLGLVVGLSLLFVALEYTSKDTDRFDSPFLADEMIEEFESVPAQQSELLASPVKEQVAEKITLVEEASQSEDDVLNKSQGEPVVIGEKELTGDDAAVIPLTPQTLEQEKETLSIRVVERLPEFPGGMSAFALWLTDHLKYPPTARQQRLQGRVVASFIIGEDGSVMNLKIVRSAGLPLDGEARRVLRLMPKWKPGEYKGNACRTLVHVPVVFKL